MKTEEIVNAVRDAGFSSSEMFLRLPAFKRLIDSAAAAERDACARLEDEPGIYSRFDMASAIRARNNK